ncbi:magnesium-translocating P-type ATPase [Kutzneria viridogrisea]|uniref:Magnesium-transporting ATPase, P-type 1 n=1 Tax=Kutzneria viridogrisea TaxID=47990 RepID=A0ABR6BF76_9PSEU|nr:Mg2+-importing ATPase [Kutzneria viridogrisea]
MRTTTSVAATLTELSTMDTKALIRHLDGHPAGLTTFERDARLARHGKNLVAAGEAQLWANQLLRCFASPFVVILLVLDLVLALTGDHKGTITVSAMVLISVGLRFWQEFRSGRAAQRLRAMVTTTATVARRGTGGTRRGVSGAVTTELPFELLVPGDVIHLSAGDLVPADCRLLTATHLVVDQATLSGESLPVDKEAGAPVPAGRNVLDSPSFCFLGSTVLSGTATAVVVGTGARTYLGSIAERLTHRVEDTSFDRGVRAASWTLIRFALVMVPIVLAVNGFSRGDWAQALLFAVSVGVGLVPEMLPVIVTANLARGAVALSRRQAIVKQLRAVQNFGAMDVLCTDKTGTLTEDRIVLDRYLDARGRHEDSVLELAFLNSALQTGLRNLLDRAVTERVDADRAMMLEATWRLVDEIPFDFSRRRLSVVVRDTDAHHLLITKGTVEDVLAGCTALAVDGVELPINSLVRKDLLEQAEELAADGLRVLAVARKAVPEQEVYQVEQEQGLTFVGYLCFLDPPKDSAAAAVRELTGHGVAVKVITGDHPLVAAKVCREVGIEVGEVVLGNQIDAADDAKLAGLVERTTVFARTTPTQKARVVRALRANGHTVGYLGDGVNDAAALREADLSVSVGSAVDVVREAAEVILLRKDLTVLAHGVVEGRRTFGNTMKYVKLTASSNFGNVLSVLAASAFLPFLPMLPVQLLVQNLIYDLSQLAMPWDRVDREYLRAPRRWEARGLARFMLVIGPLSSVFDLALFAVMWRLFGADQPALFQTGWFVEGLLSQVLIVHVIRSRRGLASRASWPVVLATALAVAAGLALPFSPVAASLGMRVLPVSYLPWLAGALLGYCLLVQLVKTWYVRKFTSWL